MSGHTPGPWTVGGSHDCIIEANNGKTMVAECVGPLTDTEKTYDQLRVDAQANARLIAAAPELLAALKSVIAIGRLLYDMDCGPQGAECIEKAEAAIEKAESGKLKPV